MNCPKCGRSMTNSDCYNTEQDGNIYINYIAGYCPWCNKYFQWEEVFTLTEITPPQEMEEDD